MKQIALLIICLLTFACTTTSGGKINNPELSILIDEAQEAIDKAASIDGEWRETRTFLEQAVNEAQQGNIDSAFKLARKAKEQGKMGYQQAFKQQKIAGPWLF